MGNLFLTHTLIMSAFGVFSDRSKTGMNLPSDTTCNVYLGSLGFCHDGRWTLRRVVESADGIKK